MKRHLLSFVHFFYLRKTCKNMIKLLKKCTCLSWVSPDEVLSEWFLILWNLTRQKTESTCMAPFLQCAPTSPLRLSVSVCAPLPLFLLSLALHCSCQYLPPRAGVWLQVHSHKKMWKKSHRVGKILVLPCSLGTVYGSFSSTPLTQTSISHWHSFLPVSSPTFPTPPSPGASPHLPSFFLFTLLLLHFPPPPPNPLPLTLNPPPQN